MCAVSVSVQLRRSPVSSTSFALGSQAFFLSFFILVSFIFSELWNAQYIIVLDGNIALTGGT